MKPFWKYTLAAFLLGLLAGGIVGHIISPWFFFRHMTPERREERILKKFNSELKLTPPQTEQVRTILRSSREKMDPLMAEYRGKFDAIRSSTAEEIKKVLTPEQVGKFEVMHRRFEERMKKRPPHPPF